MNYEGKINAQEVSSSNISTTNGKGSWKLKLDNPRWGRYLVRVTDGSGHATGQMLYFSWGNPDPNSMPGGADNAQFYLRQNIL